VTSDYRVVYAGALRQEDRRAFTERLQHECISNAMEGWRLVAAVADVDGGSTRGIWLFFAAGPSPASAEVAAAEEILERSSQ
jgi:hypothetical protein